MNLSRDALIGKEALQDAGVGRGNAFALQPFHTFVRFALRYGNRKATTAESQLTHHLHILIALQHFVEAHDANVGCAVGNDTWDVVIAHEEHLHGEVARRKQKGALGFINLDAGFGKECHRVVMKATFRLYCYT